MFFAYIRKVTVVILVVSIVLLAFLAILSIWEVLGKEVTSKSIQSMIFIAGGSLLIIVAAMERENHPLLMGKREGPKFSIVRILVILLIVWFLFSFLGSFLEYLI